jgi:hypothetical protein
MSGSGIICVDSCAFVVKTKSHAWKNAWLTSLPSAALPASGSRGLSPTRHSQPLRLPRIFFLGQNKTHPTEVNARYAARPDRALRQKLSGASVAAAILSSALQGPDQLA